MSQKLVVHVWCENATNRDNISDSIILACVSLSLEGDVMFNGMIDSKVETTAEQKLKFDLKGREKVPFNERIESTESTLCFGGHAMEN